MWGIQKGVFSPPFVGVWARGGAKSTSAELACALLGARQTRRYGLYICETQERADDHVGNVGAMLESRVLDAYYPELGQRLTGKYGTSKGWRRNRLRSASGFTLDAIGLDSAARGAKVDEDRPDFMVIDDVDDKLDSVETVEKKLSILKNDLLPAGSGDLVVLVIQNLIHENGVVARLVDDRADFLVDRIVSGPHPALEDAAYEQRGGKWAIVAGKPTWAGQSLADCQALMNRIGYSSFLSECQHEIQEPEGGLFGHIVFTHCEPEDVPALRRVVVWVDPAVTDNDQSDAQGIQADGLGEDDKIYRLWSWEGRTSPLDAMTRAITVGVHLGAEAVGVETDQGGDTWSSVYWQACESLVADGTFPKGTAFPRMRSDKAGAGHGPKTHRASQMLADYELGRFVHVLGTHGALERGLRRFGLRKPFDLADAAYWSWQDLAKPSGLIGTSKYRLGNVTTPKSTKPVLFGAR